MTQRGINIAVFAFIGVIAGILLAAYSDYSAARDVALAMIVGGGLGALVGSHWNVSAKHQVGLDDKR